MKTNYFKIGIAVVAIILTISTSVVSYASQEKANAKVIVYVSPIGRPPCSIAVICETIPGPLCTYLYQGIRYQAFGKIFPNDTTCPIVYYQWPL